MKLEGHSFNTLWEIRDTLLPHKSKWSQQSDIKIAAVLEVMWCFPNRPPMRLDQPSLNQRCALIFLRLEIFFTGKTSKTKCNTYLTAVLKALWDFSATFMPNVSVQKLPVKRSEADDWMAFSSSSRT